MMACVVRLDQDGPPPPKKKPSAISGRKYRKRDLVRIDTLRPSLADRIRADHPDLPAGAPVRVELRPVPVSLED